MKTPRNSPANPQGDTLPVQGGRQQRSLRQPHERDESADSQGSTEPSQQLMGELAHDSLARGETDTDRGPVLDKVYDKVREGASQPVKQRRR